MFLDKDGVRWVCFGKGTVAFANSKVYEAESGPQVEVQLRDALVEHPISGTLLDVPAGTIASFPCKVVLGFNKLESIDGLLACLSEARAELKAALDGEKP